MKYRYLILLLATSLSAYCQTDPTSDQVSGSKTSSPLPPYRPGFAVMLSAGSAGGGVAVGYSINRQLAARLGFNMFNYSGTLKSGKDSDNLQIGFDYKLKLQTTNLLLDFYPFKRSGFRVTGGAFYNLNQISFFGKPVKDVTFNDVTFTVDEVGTLDGKATFNKIAPYIGLGFGNPYTRGRLKFMADVGFFYQQSPTISFTTTGMLTPSSDQGPIIQKNLSPLKYYPIVTLGASYKL
ncbi:hypothetical protein [Spirosoma utsteinense]|uniref:Outer membrane protein beta-barrel domain-containing protein n=1 Tax=Spirosoma utsteinense TaxID=2585773 RepID=A0ABR6W8I8_9BACT|nr:hypothetical protein [Spirosoma utsteinense]MBC3784084.1 hypothetical protein [Spirosoma utsteinense]MBC3792827.1 hypothetical protein [Spirosoma utsteinense]